MAGPNQSKSIVLGLIEFLKKHKREVEAEKWLNSIDQSKIPSLVKESWDKYSKVS